MNTQETHTVNIQKHTQLNIQETYNEHTKHIHLTYKISIMIIHENNNDHIRNKLCTYGKHTMNIQ